MARVFSIVASIAVFLLFRVPVASAAGFHGLGIDETLSAEPALDRALTGAALAPAELPLFVRLLVSRGEIETAPGDSHYEALEARIDLYARRGIPVVLALTDPLPGPDQVEPWRQFLRALAARTAARVKAFEFEAARGGTLAPAPRPPAKDFAYVLKLSAVQVRSVDPTALVVLGGLRSADSAWMESLYREDVAGYLDVLGLPVGALEGVPPRRPLGTSPTPQDPAPLLALVDREDLEARVAVTGVALGDEPGEASRRMLDWQLGQLGGRVSLVSYAGAGPALAAALSSAAVLKDVLGAEVVGVEDASTELKLLRIPSGEDVTGSLAHRILYNVANLSTYFVYWGAPDTSGSLQIELTDATGRTPVVRDPLGRQSQNVRGFAWDAQSKKARLTVPLAPKTFLVDFNYGGEKAYVGRAEVDEKVLPSVAEILARHQQAQTAQDEALESYVANARMEQHFRPSATDPGFDVVTENRFYFDRAGSEWEELSFTLNGTRWGPKRPPFPMLQPEKVLSLPLDLRLDKDYAYKLQGLDRVLGLECYELRFDPVDPNRSLYRGTVWIDTKTFLKVKVHAVQTRLSAPVVSNDETQYFGPAGDAGGRTLSLFSRLVNRQILLIAGRNLLLEREIHFSDFKLNSPDFKEARATSRAGGNIMFRDTDRGLRYFVKKGGERVVEEGITEKARALAIGLTVDPSFDFPLPILGINYLDFSFLGKNNQLALLFGGVVALANVQRPKILGEHVDASLDFFAIGIPVNDQVYRADGERRDERLRTIPFSTGVNLGWQFTSFQKLSGSYQFRYDAYRADKQTAADYTVPPDTVTNGLGLTYEYKRGGYSFAAGGSRYRRGSWGPWGRAGDYDPENRTYEKYSVSLSKDFFLSPLQKVHLNAAYYGGRNLDRFSRYQFGLFDENRVRGVPSAGVRFAELGMIRGSYSFNVFDQYRLDVFVDQAVGRNSDRDLASRDTWRAFTGLGIGVNFRAPWNTMFRGDIGKSFLPSRYSGSGSVVAQFMILKPL